MSRRPVRLGLQAIAELHLHQVPGLLREQDLPAVQLVRPGLAMALDQARGPDQGLMTVQDRYSVMGPAMA
jgi:hypothetical protein